MFIVHLTFAAMLIAAVAAGFLLLTALSKEGAARRVGQWMSGIALALSVSGLLCAGYYGVAYWREGVYNPKNVSMAMSMMPNDARVRDMMEKMWSCQQHGATFNDCFKAMSPQETVKSAH